MLLRDFCNIKTFFPPCHPGEADILSAEAECTDEISEVFPYLNAIMKGTIYNQSANSLNFKLGGRGITLYPNKALVTNLKNKEEVIKVFNELKNLINRTWDKRDKIEPSYKTRAQIGVLDIFKLLPRTNCKECGEATCMAFAAKVVNEETTIDRCKPIINEKKYANNRSKLFALLDEAGYKTQ